MPKLQPFTRAARGDISSHVVVTSLPEVYELAVSKLGGVVERQGQPGFRLATGEVHGHKVTIAMRPVGPSALAILLEELSRLGARVVVSLDTAMAIAPSVEVGSILVATAAIKGDGVSKNYMPVEIPATADFELLRHVQQVLSIHNVETRPSLVWSLDTYYVTEQMLEHALRLYGKYAAALDMDTAALYTVAMARKLHAASILVVEASGVKGVDRGSYISGSEELRRRIHETFSRIMKPLLEAMALHREKDRGRARLAQSSLA